MSSLTALERDRRMVESATGPVNVVDTGGDGPVAVFVHGVGTSSALWRNLLPHLRDLRRCVAPDLPLHGGTPMRPDQEVSLRALADFVLGTLDAMGVADYDLVANDTGGAVAQIVAASAPERVRTLTLTNCETHDNVPPKAFLPTVLLARSGLLARRGPKLLEDMRRARKAVYGSGYADITTLPEEVVEAWLRPVFGTPERARQFQRWITSLRPDDLLAVEPALRQLEAPTLVAWGTDDVFFKPKWARWLVDTIPGAQYVTWIEGGRLFFPDERAADLAPAVRRLWSAASGSGRAA
jgi:pimeloyl-ACP methyl ester carboxylesterase